MSIDPEDLRIFAHNLHVDLRSLLVEHHERLEARDASLAYMTEQRDAWRDRAERAEVKLFAERELAAQTVQAERENAEQTHGGRHRCLRASA